MAKQLLALFFFLCLALLVSSKNTINVDTIYPATEPYVTIDRANADSTNVGVLNVGILNVPSSAGVSATSGSLSINGGSLSAVGDNSISFSTEASGINITAAAVGDFVAGSFSVLSGQDVDISTSTSTLTFSANQTLMGNFTSNFNTNANRIASFIAGNGNVALSVTDNLNSTTGFADFNGGSGSQFDAGELQVTARQTFVSFAETVNWKASNLLSISSNNNNILMNSGNNIVGNFSTDVDFSGNDRLIIDSPQGTVQVSADGNINGTSNILDVVSHRNIDITSQTNSIDFASQGDTVFNGVNGVTMQSTSGDINLASDKFFVQSNQLVIDYAGSLAINSISTTIQASESLAINSQSGIAFTSQNGQINLLGPEGVSIGAYTTLSFGTDNLNHVSSGNVLINPAGNFIFQAGTGVFLNASISVSFTSSFSSIKNNLLGTNNFDYKGTGSILSAPTLSFVGQQLNFDGQSTTLTSLDFNIGEPLTFEGFTLGNIPQVVEISSIQQSFTAPTFSLNSGSTYLQTSSFSLNTASIAISSNTRPVTFSGTPGAELDFTSPSFSVQTNNFVLDGGMTIKAPFTSSSVGLSVDALSSLSWGSAASSFNWNGGSLDVSAGSLTLQSTGSTVSLSGNTFSNFKGSWSATATDAFSISGTTAVWESQLGNSISINNATFSIPNSDNINFNGRSTSFSTTGALTVTTANFLAQATSNQAISFSSSQPMTFVGSAAVTISANNQNFQTQKDTTFTATVSSTFNAANTTNINTQSSFIANSGSISLTTRYFELDTASLIADSATTFHISTAESFGLALGGGLVSVAQNTSFSTQLNEYLTATQGAISFGFSLNSTDTSIAALNIIAHSQTENFFGDLSLSAPTINFMASAGASFNSGSSLLFSGGSLTVDANSATLTSSEKLSVLVQGNFISNANNMTFTSTNLNISNTGSFNTFSNNDVIFNVGDLSVSTSGASSVGNGIFLFSTNERAGVSISTGTSFSINGYLGVQFTTSDLSKFGYDTSISSVSGAVSLANILDPQNNPSLNFLQSGGYQFNPSLGIPVGAIFSAGSGSGIIVNSDSSDIFLLTQGALEFNSQTSFTANVDALAWSQASGSAYFISDTMNMIADGAFLSATGDIQWSSNGASNMQLVHGLSIGGTNIEFITNNGAIQVIDDSNYLTVTTSYSENLAIGSFTISVQNQTQFIANNNDIIFTLSAVNDITFSSYGDSLFSADGSAIFTATTSTVSSSIGNPIAISWSGLTVDTTQDFSITSETSGSFDYINFSVGQTTFAIAKDIKYESYGSVSFENSDSFTINSATNQYYNARQQLLVDASNAIIVGNAQISIFAGGSGVQNAVKWTSKDLQINATKSIKQSANEYSLSTKDFNFVGTNGITFSALGTPGVARDIFAFANSMNISGLSNFYSTSTTGSFSGSNAVTIDSLATINVTVARLLDLGADGQIIIDNFNANLNANGKFSFNNLNNFQLYGNSLSYLADTTMSFQSGVLSFVETGAFSVTAENLNNVISFTTADDSSNIEFKSSQANVSVIAHNRLITNVNNGIDFTSSVTLVQSQDEIDVSTIGSFNQFFSTSLAVSAQQISFLIGGHSYIENLNTALNDNNLFVQSDNNIIFNSTLSTTYQSQGAGTFESGLNTTFSGGSTQFNAGYFDFIVRGSSVENYGVQFYAASAIFFQTQAGNTNLDFTGGRNVDMIAQTSSFTAGNPSSSPPALGNLNISALGSAGATFQTARSGANTVVNADIQFNAYQSIQFHAYGNQYAAGTILMSYSDAAAFFGGNGLSQISSSAGLVFKGLSNSFEIPSTGSISVTVNGEDNLGVGMTFESSGFINFVTSSGATAFVGDSIRFFVDQRPLTALSNPPFGIYSLDNPGFQGQQIEMTAFGPNQNGNGIEISSADQDSDIVISAEVRGEVQFNSGSEILIEGSHGVSIVSKDDNVITSVSSIQIAGLGRSYIDQQDASVIFSSTNPLGAASGNSLGTNIQFYSTTQVNLTAAEALILDAYQSLSIATSLTSGTTTLQGNNGLTINAPLGTLFLSGSQTVSLEGNSVTINTDLGITANAASASFVAFNRDVDIRTVGDISITGNLVAASGLKYLDVSNDDYLVVNTQFTTCPSGGNGYISSPILSAGVHYLPFCAQGTLVNLPLA